METELEKFDVNQAMQSVKEKIKDAFVSLIPDERWNEMVEKEINSYFRYRDAGYGHRGQTSSFTEDVHQVLTQEVQQRVKEYLQSNFQTTWTDNGIPICDKKVEEIITQNAGTFLSSLIGVEITHALRSAGYNIK